MTGYLGPYRYLINKKKTERIICDCMLYKEIINLYVVKIMLPWATYFCYIHTLIPYLLVTGSQHTIFYDTHCVFQNMGCSKVVSFSTIFISTLYAVHQWSCDRLSRILSRTGDNPLVCACTYLHMHACLYVYC